MSAAIYPADYGYLRDTLGQDGDALDALVCLYEPTFPGCLIPVKPVGLFEDEVTRRASTTRSYAYPLVRPVLESSTTRLELASADAAPGDRAVLLDLQGPRGQGGSAINRLALARGIPGRDRSAPASATARHSPTARSHTRRRTSALDHELRQASLQKGVGGVRPAGDGRRDDLRLQRAARGQVEHARQRLARVRAPSHAFLAGRLHRGRGRSAAPPGLRGHGPERDRRASGAPKGSLRLPFPRRQGAARGRGDEGSGRAAPIGDHRDPRRRRGPRSGAGEPPRCARGRTSVLRLQGRLPDRDHHARGPPPTQAPSGRRRTQIFQGLARRAAGPPPAHRPGRAVLPAAAR